ncbi:MAG: helix-hairpin-helix domain-containing protein [Acidimicrobiia bacterium]|nr:helix-hairpin-helix domain-containing protein [Acidimicrobiia bacterium]
MRRFVRFVGLVTGVAAIAYLMRDKLVRIPEEPVPPPHFRADSPNGEAAAPDKATRAVLADDLTEITGIGPAYSKRLADAGINTFAELVAADIAATAEAVDVSADQVADWADQARQRLN